MLFRLQSRLLRPTTSTLNALSFIVRGQFSRLLAAEVCASAVVMLDTPCSEVVWRVLATHSIRQFPLHFPSRASPCAITVQLESTLTMLKFGAVAPVVQCCSTQLVVHKNKAYWRYTCTPTRGLQLHVAAVVRAVSKHEKQHYLVFEIYWHLGGGWNYVSSNKVTIVALIKTQNTASAYPTATPPPPNALCDCLMKMAERVWLALLICIWVKISARRPTVLTISRAFFSPPPANPQHTSNESITTYCLIIWSTNTSSSCPRHDYTEEERRQSSTCFQLH